MVLRTRSAVLVPPPAPFGFLPGPDEARLLAGLQKLVQEAWKSQQLPRLVAGSSPATTLSRRDGLKRRVAIPQRLARLRRAVQTPSVCSGSAEAAATSRCGEISHEGLR